MLFPLLAALATAPARDPDATEARLRAAALLCKAFMRFEVRETPAPALGDGPAGPAARDVRVPWVRVLDALDALMGSDPSDQMVRGHYRRLRSVFTNDPPFPSSPPPIVPDRARRTRRPRRCPSRSRTSCWS